MDLPAATAAPYWADKPDQHRQTNRLHRCISIGAAQRELAGSNGPRSALHCYEYVALATWARHFHNAVFPPEPILGTKSKMLPGGLNKFRNAPTAYTCDI